MFKFLKQYKFYIILFAFLLIPLLSIDTATRAPHEYRVFDRIILAVTTPIQSSIRWMMDGVFQGFHQYLYLWNLRKENDELILENQKLLFNIVNLKEAESGNIRLRELLKFKEEFDLRSVTARVIAKDVSREFRAIRINRGAEDGLKKDMPVVNHLGIVGRILRTTEHTSDIVILLDLLSSIDVIDQRSRARGIVQGTEQDLLELKFALRTDDIQKGDLLISSGLGGVFPKGLPVGTVERVEKKNYGMTQSVFIEPAVNFAKLEEVFVITEFKNAPIHQGDIDPFIHVLENQGERK